MLFDIKNIISINYAILDWHQPSGQNCQSGFKLEYTGLYFTLNSVSGEGTGPSLAH